MNMELKDNVGPPLIFVRGYAAGEQEVRQEEVLL